MGFPSNAAIQGKKANLKLETIGGNLRLEQGLINMLQKKIYIRCKTVSNCIRIQESTFVKQKPKMPHLIARGDNRDEVFDVRSLYLNIQFNVVLLLIQNKI